MQPVLVTRVNTEKTRWGQTTVRNLLELLLMVASCLFLVELVQLTMLLKNAKLQKKIKLIHKLISYLLKINGSLSLIFFIITKWM